MSDSNGRICVPKTHALTTWRIPDTWQNHILSSAFTYWLLTFTQNFQPPHCPTLFFSNTRRLSMKEKTDEKPSSSIANLDLEVGGLSLFARVGGNAVSNRSFQCYSKLSAANPMSFQFFFQFRNNPVQIFRTPVCLTLALALFVYHGSTHQVIYVVNNTRKDVYRGQIRHFSCDIFSEQ